MSRFPSSPITLSRAARLVDLVGGGGASTRSFTSSVKRDRHRSSSLLTDSSPRIGSTTLGTPVLDLNRQAHTSPATNSRATPTQPPKKPFRKPSNSPKDSENLPYIKPGETLKGSIFRGRKISTNAEEAVVELPSYTHGWDEVRDETFKSKEHEDWGKDGVVKKGMLVEYRRQEQSNLGVVLARVLEEKRIRYPVLSSNGTIVPCSDDDIQYIFPYSPTAIQLADQAVPSDEEMPTSLGYSATTSQPVAVPGGVPQATQESTKFVLAPSVLEARRRLAQVVRIVVKEAENRSRVIAANPLANAETLWDAFAGPQGLKSEDGHDKWTFVTVDQAARFALGLGKDANIDPIDHVAMSRVMFDHPELFLSEETEMRAKSSFAVRPREMRDNLKTVKGWFGEWKYAGSGEKVVGGGKEMEDFLVQARGIVNFRREAEKKLKEELGNTIKPPRIIPLEGVEPFSETSKLIIDVLMTRLLEQRSTQASAYQSTVSGILKALDLYGLATLDLGLLTDFLRDIGEMLPWESLIKRRFEHLERRDSAMALDLATRKLPSKPVELLVEDPHTSVRHDFGDHTVYVVDSEDAKELDDGFSLERTDSPDVFWFHVHIADPTRWLTPEHPFSLEAERRAESLYLAEGFRSMLPEDFVMGSCSLRESSETDKEPQFTLSFSSKVNREGKILESKVRTGHIRNVKKISYNAVDALLASGEESLEESQKQVYKDMKDLVEMTDAIKKTRLSVGGFDWGTNQAEVGLDTSKTIDLAGGKPSITIGSPEMTYTMIPTDASTAAVAVAELMITTGRVAGAYCKEQNIPVPYRGSNKPFVPKQSLPAGKTEEEVLQEFAETQAKEKISYIDYIVSGLWSFPTGSSLVPVEHWGLGIQAKDGGYVRVTSPLRRFADMLCHWQIKSSLLPGATKSTDGKLGGIFPLEEITQRARESLRREARVRRANSSSVTWWQVAFVKSYLEGDEAGFPNVDSTKLNARTIGLSSYSMGRQSEITEVFLEDLMIRGEISEPTPEPLPENRRFPLGSNVKVKLADATLWPRAVVYLDVVDDTRPEKGEKVVEEKVEEV